MKMFSQKNPLDELKATKIMKKRIRKWRMKGKTKRKLYKIHYNKTLFFSSFSRIFFAKF